MKTNLISVLKKSWLRTVFLVSGISSLIWFLIRVVPKPSRAGYPCMKAAAPMASSFVSYLIAISGLMFFMNKVRKEILLSKYLKAIVFIVFGLSAGVFALLSNNNTADAIELQSEQTGNEPIGEAKGTFPGRVVWIHNSDATDENLTNEPDDYWFQNENTNTAVVQSMLTKGICDLTGMSTAAEAWQIIFSYYNTRHGRGDQGYTSGEKVAIKVNMNNFFIGAHGINTSPQVMYALIDQLVNVVGIAQGHISIGDPNMTMDASNYDLCRAAFPDVLYWSFEDEFPEFTSNDVFFTSDDSYSSPLPKAYVEATYLINVPVFKKHHRAGISISSKNHFGSMANGASPLHPSLPVPDGSESGEPANLGYGIYRCFVDIMGHKDLGDKTILYLVDGLWGSTNFGHPPIKWRMSPFNNDWPNSLFLSQDPVAIESVCFDFLYAEFDDDHPTEGLPVTYDKGPFARFPGTDDFLHQAADISNWPSDIDYDPENDGTLLTSMGTHEHWNNATDKQYSRNLGTGGLGIELIYDRSSGLFDQPEDPNNRLSTIDVSPNPFTEFTTIAFNISEPAVYTIRIFNLSGKLVSAQNSDIRNPWKNPIFMAWN